MQNQFMIHTRAHGRLPRTPPVREPQRSSESSLVAGEQDRVERSGRWSGAAGSGADLVKDVCFVPSIWLWSKGLANVEKCILLARPVRAYGNL